MNRLLLALVIGFGVTTAANALTVKVVSTGRAYDIGAEDVVCVKARGGIQLTLPSPASIRVIGIKDCIGGASEKPIVIGGLVDGVYNPTIGANWGYASVFSDGRMWHFGGGR
jgi:hypothetical protein